MSKDKMDDYTKKLLNEKQVSGYDAFKERLRERREDLGISQSQLANNIGVAVGTIQNYEYGYSPKGVNIVKLAHALDCDVGWLLTGEESDLKRNREEVRKLLKKERLQGEADSASELKQDDLKKESHKITTVENEIHIPQWEDPDPAHYHFVPMAKAKLNGAGGAFVLSEETTGRYYAFRKRFLNWIASSPKNVILMKVTGDSMEPRIEDGDSVMIDTGRREVHDGCIYALGYDDTIVVKAIERLPKGRVRVLSTNPDYSSYDTNINDIRILGQIIWADRVLIK